MTTKNIQHEMSSIVYNLKRTPKEKYHNFSHGKLYFNHAQGKYQSSYRLRMHVCL